MKRKETERNKHWDYCMKKKRKKGSANTEIIGWKREKREAKTDYGMEKRKRETNTEITGWQKREMREWTLRLLNEK